MRRFSLIVPALALVGCYVYREPDVRVVYRSSTTVEPAPGKPATQPVASAPPVAAAPPVASLPPIVEPGPTPRTVPELWSPPAGPPAAAPESSVDAGRQEAREERAGQVRCLTLAADGDVLAAAILSGDAPATRLDVVMILPDGTERARSELWLPDGGESPGCPAIAATSDGTAFHVVAFDASLGVHRAVYTAVVASDGTVRAPMRAIPLPAAALPTQSPPAIGAVPDGVRVLWVSEHGAQASSLLVDPNGEVIGSNELAGIGEDPVLVAERIAWRRGSDVHAATWPATISQPTGTVIALHEAAGRPALAAQGPGGSGDDLMVVAVSDEARAGYSGFTAQRLVEGTPAGPPVALRVPSGRPSGFSVAGGPRGAALAFVSGGRLWALGVHPSGVPGDAVDLGAAASPPAIAAFGDGFVVAATTAGGHVVMMRLDPDARPVRRGETAPVPGRIF